MSLLNVQNFLARIYTDETLRRQFTFAPERIGKENNLSANEIAELAAILPVEINFFADSLRWKRLREVEKLLPLTRQVLKERFEILFSEFTNQFLPESTKKHLEDAIEFTRFLQSKEVSPVWAKDLAKFERAKLEFNAHGKNFIFKTFDYDVKEMLYQGIKAQSEIKRKRTFSVWLKIGKRTRHFVW
jgi:hypothetical protein